MYTSYTLLNSSFMKKYLYKCVCGCVCVCVCVGVCGYNVNVLICVFLVVIVIPVEDVSNVLLNGSHDNPEQEPPQ